MNLRFVQLKVSLLRVGFCNVTKKVAKISTVLIILNLTSPMYVRKHDHPINKRIYPTKVSNFSIWIFFPK